RAVQHRPPAPPAELVAVAPGRELGPERRADAYQFHPLEQPREPDVLRRDAHARAAEQPLAVLDRLPALLERREVPALALAAHDPEPALRAVERDAPADREVLEHLVRAER